MFCKLGPHDYKTNYKIQNTRMEQITNYKIKTNKTNYPTKVCSAARSSCAGVDAVVLRIEGYCHFCFSFKINLIQKNAHCIEGYFHFCFSFKISLEEKCTLRGILNLY